MFINKDIHKSQTFLFFYLVECKVTKPNCKSKQTNLDIISSGNSFFSSLVQFSRSVMSDSWWPHELQHATPPCPSPTPRVHPDSHPSSQWCRPAISSSVIPFSSCHQSFPASGTSPISQFFTSGNQSIGVSASASVLPALHYSHILPCFRKPTLLRKHYGSSFNGFPLEPCHEYIHLSSICTRCKAEGKILLWLLTVLKTSV